LNVEAILRATVKGWQLSMPQCSISLLFMLFSIAGECNALRLCGNSVTLVLAIFRSVIQAASGCLDPALSGSTLTSRPKFRHSRITSTISMCMEYSPYGNISIDTSKTDTAYSEALRNEMTDARLIQYRSQHNGHHNIFGELAL
jgi:hypothetical protein